MDSPPTATPTDARLLATIATDGEAGRAAWAELVRRHAPRMYAVARSFGLAQAAAEDVVQVAWLRLLERSDQLRSPGSLGAWLCTIVRNEACRLVARRREIPTEATMEAIPDLQPSLETGLIRTERALALRLAFARLNAECQQLLRLMMVEPPLSYDEIAAATGRPRGSLGPTRRRCLDRLRALLPSGFEA